MIISIHQPNFIPWYPYFQKMAAADKFILLGHCQFEKNLYQNRFNMNDRWYTMSTFKGMEPIVDKKYVKPLEDFKVIKEKLKNYSPILTQFDECINESLYETNCCIIRKIASMLNIKTEILTDTPTTLKSTERLVEICKMHNATTYISGHSGPDYMDMSLFEKAGIEVIVQKDEDMIKKPILEVLKI